MSGPNLSLPVLPIRGALRSIKFAYFFSFYTEKLKAYTQPVHLSMTMRTALCLAALASVAYSAPQPQLINLDTIALDYAPPELVEAPINVQLDIPAAATPDAITPLQSVSAKKRDLESRDGDCSPYPAGSGPVPSPDTPSAFQSDPDFAVCLFN